MIFFKRVIMMFGHGDDFERFLEFLQVSEEEEQAIRQNMMEIYDDLRSLGPERAMEEYGIESFSDYRKYLETLQDIIENGVMGGSRPIPGFRVEGDEIVEVDAQTGEEIDRYETPTGPDGETMEPFAEYRVRLLRDLGPHSEGDETVVFMDPSGLVRALAPDGVIDERVEEGEDFEFIDDEPVGNRQGPTQPPAEAPAPEPEMNPGDLPFGGHDPRERHRFIKRMIIATAALSLISIGTIAYLLFSDDS